MIQEKQSLFPNPHLDRGVREPAGLMLLHPDVAQPLVWGGMLLGAFKIYIIIIAVIKYNMYHHHHC